MSDLAKLDTKPDSKDDDRHSVARGIAMLALIAIVLATTDRIVRELTARGPALSRRPVEVCDVPVELSVGGGSRLVCATDVLPRGCGALRPGDRVALDGRECHVDPQGMAARMKLLCGLPLLLNRVSAQDLEELNGIGKKRAEAIISHREEHGAFQAVDDLILVKGIGRKTLTRLRANLTVVVSLLDSAEKGVIDPSCASRLDR